MDGEMLTLAFDTATEMCTVALGNESGLLVSIDLLAPRAHLEKLLPLAQQALELTGRAQSEIEAIAVGVGPGSLTGVRIGVTTARSLAQALEVPCIGVSTLEVLAAAFSRSGALVCALIDARRGEIYPGLYDCSGTRPRMLGEHRSIGLDELIGELEKHDRVVLSGDALVTYGDELAERLGDRVRLAPREQWYPKAADLLPLAGRDLEAGAGDYRDVRPIYTRLSDAEEAEAARR
ncbi:MAG: tRNA (adenosine(37)-N6)-threonylcarbamoyltransferase complex dimerization subunit type 1 TsaB [Actinobacteria bacterium]|nr:MAG: tRNA (adenosine(37)-N6)-threonylcarbamoyltransferase complex dimerization subunit type 1 TsaB [Actinomycetota bacterium]